MDDRWRWALLAVVIVAILSVGITEGYSWYRLQPYENADADADDCDSAAIQVRLYTGDAPENGSYDNLSAAEQRQFDQARQAEDNLTTYDRGLTENFTRTDYVVYENETYFVTKRLADCPDVGPPDWLGTVLAPFLLISRLVDVLWLPAVVVGGIAIAWRKWMAWIRFD